MIEQASLVIGEGNWAVKSDSLLGYKINNGKYYPREMSVVRATTGTRINEDGLVEVVPYNLLQHSEVLNSSFTSQNVGGTGAFTITQNYAAAPNGTITADRIQMSATSGSGNYVDILYPSPNAVTGVVYTYSVYIKSLSGTPNIGFLYANGANQIVTLTNDWVRYDFTFTGVAGLVFPRFLCEPASGTSTSADILVWGWQLVEGSSALDYLPTTDRLDVARIDYSSGSAALLVEPQRTNLLTYSSSFSNAAWIKFNASISANVTATLDPSGNYGASKIVEDSSSAFHDIDQVQTYSAGANTISVYAKSAGRNHIFLQHFDGSSFLTSGTFNLSNGTVSGNGNIESVGNGWYRCSFTATTVNGTGKSYINLSNGTSGNYQGDGTSGVYIWGAQLEAGSYATSYIPTQGSTVTRNADVISKTGIADLIGQTEGTLFTEVIYDASIPTLAGGNDQPLLVISNGTSNNYISILLQGSNDNKVIGYCLNGGSLQALIASSAQTSGTIKIAVSYKSNYFALFVNGVKIGQDTSFNVPATNQLNIGSYLNSGSQFLANVKTSAIWKTQLTDAQCQTLTTI